MGRLSELTVLVTGASTPLGRAVIGRLVAEGAQTVGAYFSTEPPTDDQPASRMRTVRLDVTDPAGWQQVADDIDASGSGLHGLVHVAASAPVGSLTETAPQLLSNAIDVNMLGPVLGMGVMAPLMARSGGGSIVHVASTGAVRGARDAAVLSATGWGLRGLTRSAAVELGPSGIRVNTVCPSIGLMHDGIESTPGSLGDDGGLRPVTMGDVAAMVAFLLSDDSATCSGGDFLVDAGASA